MASLFAAPISALVAGSKAAESLSNTIAGSGGVAGPSFQTYLVSSASGGVSSTSVRQLSGVGAPTAGSPDSFAIAGQGFAIVRNLPGDTADGKGTIGYTRVNNFSQDSGGNFRTPTGQYLQAFLLDEDGKQIGSDLNDLVTLKTGGLTQNAEATTSATFKTQLAANATSESDPFLQTIQVFDSLGASHNVALTWQRIDTPAIVGGQALPAGATQYWKLTVSTPDGTVTPGADGYDYTGDASGGSGFIVSFDATGKPVQWGYPLPTPTPTDTTKPPALGITWTEVGPAASSIALNFGTIGKNDGMTSLGPANKIIASPDINGSSTGSFKSLSISQDGTVSITYTNDKTVKYARIPLALFNNPDGLVNSGTGDGVFAVSGESGAYQLVFPGVDGAGSLAVGMYETSPNDSTKAYISLIEVSRYFANNVKVIQAAQKMYDKLDQL